MKLPRLTMGRVVWIVLVLYVGGLIVAAIVEELSR